MPTDDDHKKGGCLARLANPIVLTLLGIMLLLVLGAGLVVFKILVLDVQHAKKVRAQIDQELTLLSEAIEEYVGTSGTYPDALEQIVGLTWSGALPVDPFSPTGEPYVYETLAGKEFAIVYSVGPDGEPHHGMRDITNVVGSDFDSYRILEHVQIDRALREPDNRIDLIMRASLLGNELTRSDEYTALHPDVLDTIRKEGWEAATAETINANNAAVKAARVVSQAGGNTSNNPYMMAAAQSPAATGDPREAVVRLIETNREAMELIHEGVQAASTAVIIRDDELSYTTPVINFLSMQILGKVLVAEGKRLEAEGNPEQAVEKYLDTVGLGHAIATGPTLIYDLIGVVLANMGTTALQEAVREGNLEEELLVTVMEDLERRERHWPSMSESILAEHEAFKHTIQDTQGLSYDFMANTVRQSWDQRLMPFYLLFYGDGVIANNREGMTEMAAVVAGEKEEMTFDWSTTDPVNRIHSPNFLHAGIRERVMLVNLRSARIAAALELYKLHNGEYPQTLEALEEFMGPLPEDPFHDGETFHYERTEARYSLWSRGPDELDEGGTVIYDPSNGTTSAGDVVIGE